MLDWGVGAVVEWLLLFFGAALARRVLRVPLLRWALLLAAATVVAVHLRHHPLTTAHAALGVVDRAAHARACFSHTDSLLLGAACALTPPAIDAGDAAEFEARGALSAWTDPRAWCSVRDHARRSGLPALGSLLLCVEDDDEERR